MRLWMFIGLWSVTDEHITHPGIQFLPGGVELNLAVLGDQGRDRGFFRHYVPIAVEAEFLREPGLLKFPAKESIHQQCIRGSTTGQ